MTKILREIGAPLTVLFGVGSGFLFEIARQYQSRLAIIVAFVYLTIALRIANRLRYIPNTPAQGDSQ